MRAFDQQLATQVLGPGLRALSSDGQLSPVHIFTTNYDRVIEHACGSSDIDLSDGFGSMSRELVAPWTQEFDGKVRLYKLHGSVSYYVDHHEAVEGKFLRLDRGYPLPGPDFRLSREGNQLEPLMVLPTLEKDTLREPYSYLNQAFFETMSRTVVVVAIGTSLRDAHIVSAIKYNAERVVVIVIDEEPLVAAGRLSGVASVKLRTDARRFWENSLFELMSVLKECLENSHDREHVHKEVEAFAARESDRIGEFTGLTERQQDALRGVLASDDNAELLRALHTLRGLNAERVVQAVASKLEDGAEVDVRKAAVACLGHSGNALAVRVLGRIAIEDASSDVRLESYLALSAIGSESANRSLAAAKARWPADAYFLS